MHTDEFEISLSREIKVCENTIKRIEKTLSLLEQKHHKTTEAFLEEYRNGALQNDPDHADDYTVWSDSVASLEQWRELERGYREQFKNMKI